ncbi:MAG: helix-turn-helix domain-containing protein [Polyangiaceae bacterium]
MSNTTPAPSEEPTENETEINNAITIEQLPEVLTVNEVARLLRVNRKTVYRAIERGEFPCARRIGNTIRVARDAMLRWLDGQAGVSPLKKSGAR